tara:strand:- start:996 stop:1259 length:264 start_codon:yes stop_codon:yes gene_type:complete
MSKAKEKQPIPKWFNGEIYKKGNVVQNRFGGESCELNALELSIYDFIIGASDMVELGMHHDKLIIDLRKGLDWFKKYNAKAYMVLLD